MPAASERLRTPPSPQPARQTPDTPQANGQFQPPASLTEFPQTPHTALLGRPLCLSTPPAFAAKLPAAAPTLALCLVPSPSLSSAVPLFSFFFPPSPTHHRISITAIALYSFVCCLLRGYSSIFSLPLLAGAHPCFISHTRLYARTHPPCLAARESKKTRRTSSCLSPKTLMAKKNPSRYFPWLISMMGRRNGCAALLARPASASASCLRPRQVVAQLARNHHQNRVSSIFYTRLSADRHQIHFLRGR